MHQQPQHGCNQATFFSNPNAQHGNQHRAQRRKARVVGDHMLQNPVQAFAGDQVDRFNDRAILGMDRRHAQLTQEPGKENDGPGEYGKDGGRMR